MAECWYSLRHSFRKLFISYKDNDVLTYRYYPQNFKQPKATLTSIAQIESIEEVPNSMNKFVIAENSEEGHIFLLSCNTDGSEEIISVKNNNSNNALSIKLLGNVSLVSAIALFGESFAFLGMIYCYIYSNIA